MAFHQFKHQSSGCLTIDGAELSTGTKRVDDVDDQAVGGSPQRQRPSTHQQGHDVEQERQMTSNCKRHTIIQLTTHVLVILHVSYGSLSEITYM